MSSFNYSSKQMIENVISFRSHAVILGAGASRACCPLGDKNGKKLPLMNDFAECLNLTKKLSDWGISPKQNFEVIFDNLYQKNETEKTQELEKDIFDYFKRIEIPSKPTIYDHLLLSLQKKDMIISFNWDPLLLQAYQRCYRIGVSLPQMYFLHGNILMGFCNKHTPITMGITDDECHCGETFRKSKLLFPIKKKDYNDDENIRKQWLDVKIFLKHAFQLTIFGFSAPEHDIEAKSLLKEGWGIDKMKQTEIINFGGYNKLVKKWTDFIFEHHYDVTNNFYKSYLSKFPRRTADAYVKQYVYASFVGTNKIPKNFSFIELGNWIYQFHEAEKNANQRI